MAKDLFGTEYDPSGAPIPKYGITQQYLREILHYDQETEEWTWLVNKGGKAPGTVAGCRHHGHWQIQIDGHMYRTSHLLCFYVSGKWRHELEKIDFESDAPSKKALRREAKQRLLKLKGEYRLEHSSWSAMRNRVLHETHAWYHRYGGRGITICERWLNSFENFIADMGRKPSPELSLGRIDNDGNYEPGNCKWATMSEQATNRETGRRQRRIAKLWG